MVSPARRSIMQPCAELFVSYGHSWGKLGNRTVIMWGNIKGCAATRAEVESMGGLCKSPRFFFFFSLHLPTNNMRVCVVMGGKEGGSQCCI